MSFGGGFAFAPEAGPLIGAVRDAGAEVFGDFRDRVGGDFGEPPDPADRLLSLDRMEFRQDPCGLVGIDGGEHECDRLGVFAAEQFGHRRVGDVAQKRE